jgi:sec-independent protein translocase protein TatC
MTTKEYQENELKSMSLGDHLEELRARLILALAGLVLASIIGFIAGRWFLHLILLPYELAMERANLELQLLAVKPAEKFLAYMKASLVLGVLISSPWLFYQVWAFVAAGLYKHERKFVKIVAPASSLLFIAGVLFFLLVIAPMVFKFFMLFDPGIQYVNYQPSLTESLNFVLLLALVFGLAFQTPIAIVFSERMGLVTVETLCRVRKYVLLAAFVVGAIATPPDVVSQIALAVPLYILYEASIVVCRFWKKKRAVVK